MYTYRETDQDPATVSALVAMLQDGEDVAPIVVIDETTILDGHHRARASEQAGVAISAISITSAQYTALQSHGYDDIEIAAAVHIVSETGGEDQLSAQFPGANVRDRAYDASDILDTL